MFEIISDTWFNQEGQWTLKDKKGESVRQLCHTYINVSEEDRSLNLIDYAKHGITYADIQNAPLFEDVHLSIEKFIRSKKAKKNIIVAHNGNSYDFPVWKKALGKLN